MNPAARQYFEDTRKDLLKQISFIDEILKGIDDDKAKNYVTQAATSTPNLDGLEWKKNKEGSEWVTLAFLKNHEDDAIPPHKQTKIGEWTYYKSEKYLTRSKR